jgi:hypothetical protein
MEEERINPESVDFVSLARDFALEEKRRTREKLKRIYCPNAGRVSSVRGEAYTACNMGSLASSCPYNQRQAIVDAMDFVHEFYVCKNRGLNPDKKQNGDIFD